MNDLTDSNYSHRQRNTRKTLSEHECIPDHPSSVVFSGDRIVWNPRFDLNPTIIPHELAKDPIISVQVKYYNSPFFNQAAKSEATVRDYRRNLQSFLDFVTAQRLDSIPANIFNLFLAHLRDGAEHDYTEKGILKKYLSVLTPFRRLSGKGQIKNKSIKRLFVQYMKTCNDEELKFARIAFVQSTHVQREPDGSKSDLVIKFGLSEDGETILHSLREFSISYLSMWADVREDIYKKTSGVLFELRDEYKNRNKAFDDKLKPNWLLSNGKGALKVVFDIVKAVNNPLLTERFITQCLLRINGSRPPRVPVCDAITKAYDYESLVSTAQQVDWINEFERNYQIIRPDHPLIKAGSLISTHVARNVLDSHFNVNNFSHPDYPGLSKEWFTQLGAALSIEELMMITPEEEICMAWLLASDRHQTSNLSRMNFSDITVTENAIGTIVTSKSFKKRSMKMGGGIYGRPDGEVYKKSSPVFEVLMSYRKQIKRAYDNGLLPDYQDFNDIPVLPFLTREGTHWVSQFQFSETRHSTAGILLCALDGSLSSKQLCKYSQGPESFIRLIKKSYHLQKNDGSALWRILPSDVDRQAINNSSGSLTTPENIPLSDNNRLQVNDSELIEQLKTDAASHNHSVQVKLDIYANKLPSYITKSNQFASRVGNEMVRMATELAAIQDEQYSVLSLDSARSLLGLSSDLDNDDVNDVNEILIQAQAEDFIVDELGFIEKSKGETIILRHPIVIALIQAKLEVIDQQIETLRDSNYERLLKVLSQRFMLAFILFEKFTPQELFEAEELYGDVMFPMSDILV